MRSLTLRLTLPLLAITAGALAVTYLNVVPPLDDRLRDDRLAELARDAQRTAQPLAAAVASDVDARVVERLVRQAAARSGERVTLLGVTRSNGGLQVDPRADSTGRTDTAELQFATALAAARAGAPRTGSEAGEAGRVGEAAVPLYFEEAGPPRRRVVGYALVLSTSLADIEDTVAVVRRRVLGGGALALALALLAILAVTRRVSLRVDRVREAARRIAAGDVQARFAVDSADEIGQLAAELDHMRTQLAQLDAARSRFIAVASHELRTPIFSLGGFLELLADEDVDEDTRGQFLAQLRGQVGRLQKLATDLLDLSKLEAGSLDLRPERTDVGVLARAVVADFTPALAAHDSHLELRLEAEPVEAVCDPERVAQVLRILVDNALTHTPAGTRMVVSAEHDDGRLRLAVADDGGGIHRTVLPHVFDPFFTSDDAQGAGLGLAIAHELAERMDGSLGVETGGGRTTFTLEVPA